MLKAVGPQESTDPAAWAFSHPWQKIREFIEILAKCAQNELEFSSLTNAKQKAENEFRFALHMKDVCGHRPDTNQPIWKGAMNNKWWMFYHLKFSLSMSLISHSNKRSFLRIRNPTQLWLVFESINSIFNVRWWQSSSNPK